MLLCMHVVFLRKVCAAHNVVVYFILFCVFRAQFVVLHEMVSLLNEN